MLRQLDLRDRLVVMAVVPLLVVATVAAGLIIFVNTADTRPFALFTAGGLVVAGFVTIAVARSIIATVDGVADGATAMAEAHRGARSERAENEEPTAAASPSAIETSEGGAIGRLVGAINEINTTVVEADRSHHDEVREGLRSIVTNLARRSQTLLDRQVEYLDRLETSEQDPDRLDQLFKVDHLATRMRRNAESLIVLAEADPGRRRGGPVDVADVLRVAMGEVEIYQQIELVDVDEGRLSAGNAVDLAHLTAELMENATQFSPPSAPVTVTGRFDGHGRFVITVADQGMGMTEERLSASNQLLADPPELGLGMGRSLGFMVIGRLAQRLNATVVVGRNEPDAGLTAVVSVPAELFLSAGSPQSRAAAPALTPAQQAQKAEGDTAEMLKPLDPPTTAPSASAATNGSAATEYAKSAQLDQPDQPSAPEPSEESVAAVQVDPTDEHAWPTAPAAVTADIPGTETDQSDDAAPVAPFDWGVGSVTVDVPVGDHQAPADLPPSDGLTLSDDDTGPIGPAPTVPLTRSTELPPTPSPTPSPVGADQTGEWIPPEVTPAAPAKLAEAVPSGDAFETGVASLLDERAGESSVERPLGDISGDGATPTGLAKRQRGTSEAPALGGRPVAAAKRNPEEVRSRLMRYREGLSGRRPKSPVEHPGPDSSADDGNQNEGR